MRWLRPVTTARAAVKRGALAGAVSWLVVIPPGAVATTWYDSTGEHELEGVGFALKLFAVDLILLGVVWLALRVPRALPALLVFVLLVCALGIGSALTLARFMPTTAVGLVVLGLAVGVSAGAAGSTLGWHVTKPKAGVARAHPDSSDADGGR